MEQLPVTRQVESLIFDRAIRLLDQPEQDVGSGRGLARATHVLAFIERTYDLYFGSDIADLGFFPRVLLNKVAYRLRHAHLQPEESKFRDILDWKKADKARLREELRTNLLRVLRENPKPFGEDALELHVLFDLRMSYNAIGYLSAIEPDDHADFPVLVSIRERFTTMFPGLLKAA